MNRQKETIDYLSRDEFKALMSVVKNPRDKALLLIAYRHGLRASEIGLLYVNDLDLTRLSIKIRRVKGSYGGEHPLQNDEAKAIRAHLKRRKVDSPLLFASNRKTAISRRTLDAMMKKYGELAGIPESKRHFHILKHSIATHLLAAGAELRWVQDWLGHKQIQNTVIYTRIANPARAESARSLFPKLDQF